MIQVPGHYTQANDKHSSLFLFNDKIKVLMRLKPVFGGILLCWLETGDGLDKIVAFYSIDKLLYLMSAFFDKDNVGPGAWGLGPIL